MRIWKWSVLLLLLALELPAQAQAQAPPARRTPEEFGYRQLVVMFGRDSVHVLIKSPKGEEHARKPLLLWVQGSLPTPLLLHDRLGAFPVFPFRPRDGVAACHFVIIGKPGIPVVADVKGINSNRAFGEKMPPALYCQRNYLDYYLMLRTISIGCLGRAFSEVAKAAFQRLGQIVA